MVVITRMSSIFFCDAYNDYHYLKNCRNNNNCYKKCIEWLATMILKKLIPLFDEKRIQLNEFITQCIIQKRKIINQQECL